MKPRKVIVVGGSMGGLFAANFLMRDGWQVQVYEKSTVPLTSRGTGIVTNTGLRTLLDKAGAPDDDTLGIFLDRRVMYDSKGGLRGDVALDQSMTAWSRLLRQLLDAFDPGCYALGNAVTAIDPGSESRQAVVTLEDGSEHEADLVVVADGVRSAFRQSVFGASPPERAGYVAWRALVLREQLSDQAQRMLGQVFAFAQAPGEQIVGYPVMGDDDNVYVNIVWYRDCTGGLLDTLLTDAAGRVYPDGIPPQLILPEHVANAKADAHRFLHPVWGEALEQAPEVILQVIVDAVTDSMAIQRVALIGDAAFTARPHIGQGVTKAAGDAWVMARSVSDPAVSVVPALAPFNEARLRIGRMTVEQSRRMGAVVYRDPGPRAEWARRYSVAENVLRESAVELPGVSGLSASGTEQWFTETGV